MNISDTYAKKIAERPVVVTRDKDAACFALALGAPIILHYAQNCCGTHSGVGKDDREEIAEWIKESATQFLWTGHCGPLGTRHQGGCEEIQYGLQENGLYVASFVGGVDFFGSESQYGGRFNESSGLFGLLERGSATPTQLRKSLPYYLNDTIKSVRGIPINEYGEEPRPTREQILAGIEETKRADQRDGLRHALRDHDTLMTLLERLEARP